MENKVNHMVGSEYDDMESFPKTESGLDKVIVVNPSKIDFTEEFNRLTEPTYIAEDLIEYLGNIKSKDVEFFNELAKLIGYLSSTSSLTYPNASKVY